MGIDKIDERNVDRVASTTIGPNGEEAVSYDYLSFSEKSIP